MKGPDQNASINTGGEHRVAMRYTRPFNAPHPDGPRSVRRRKQGGRMGVTRSPSTKRLDRETALRHLAERVED